MDMGQTTLDVQRYLDDLAGLRGDSPAEPVVRALLARSVGRLHLLCATMLHRGYPRLTRGPVNLQSEEMLGAVTERLIKALRGVRPQTVRQFFALANQHVRWELNGVARRLDERAAPDELREAAAPTPHEPDSSSSAAANARRILDAIEALPEDEREAFNLVRVQGMSQPEAAAVIGVSAKTVKRRLDHGLMLLAATLGDLRPPPPAAPGEAHAP